MSTKPGFWPAFILEIGWRVALIGFPLAVFAWWQADFFVPHPVFMLVLVVVLAPMFLLLTLLAYGFFRSGVRAVNGPRLPENWDYMSAREQAAYAASVGTHFL